MRGGGDDGGSVIGDSSHSRDSGPDQGSRGIDDVGGSSAHEVSPRLNNIAGCRDELVRSVGEDRGSCPQNTSCHMRDGPDTREPKVKKLSGNLCSGVNGIANMCWCVDDGVRHGVDGVDGEVAGSVDSVGQEVNSSDGSVGHSVDGCGDSVDYSGSNSGSSPPSVPDHMQRGKKVLLSDVT